VAAIDLEDDLTIEESRWRGRLITIGVLLVVAVGAAIGFFVYRSGGGSTTTRGTEDVTVVRKTINQTLIISGTADAQLNSNLIFQSSGKIASINVKVGDAVKPGDVLASLESDSLNNALQTAQANARAAQLKLEDLLAGSTEAQLAAADQAVASAEAGVTKAKNAQKTLLDGATAADLATAQQAVSAAEAQLATAQSNRDKLDNIPSDADLKSAEAAVDQAKSQLESAQTNAENAQNSKDSAASQLESAETAYCQPPAGTPTPDPVPAFCAVRSAPISSADADLMNSALSGSRAAAAASVIAANALYVNASNTAESAQAAIEPAQRAVDTAQAKLDAVKEGPTRGEFDSADAAVASAQASVDAANKKLQDLRDGATDVQKADAQASVDSAEAALQSALAQRAEAVRGPNANAIEQARQAIVTAQLSVDAARIRLQDAEIIAPFDGTVGAINAKIGEFFGAGSQTPPIVLLTPDRLVMKMDVGETDYANVKVGQVGGVVFDSIPGKQYPFVISEIGLSPSLTQGVVTYPVKASLILPKDAPRPAPGMNARGIIITESKQNVLVVPPRALRRSGNDQVVDVRRDGKVEEQVVTTGASDTENVEIVSGLNEGDVVVMAALAGTNGNATPQAQATLPGGVR
jgi:RND family efflux transporter MFP subunit